MKNTVRRAVRDQRGMVFIVVLIFMLFGFMIITPLMSYMYGGRLNTNRNENRMHELYAADAGIEYAIRLIQVRDAIVPDVVGDIGTRDIPSGYSGRPETINRKNVESITMTLRGDNVTNTSLEGVYRIVSTAAGPSSNTTVTANARLIISNTFMLNAITARNDVTIQPAAHSENSTVVVGNVQYGGDIKTVPATLEIGDVISGNVTHEEADWPTEQEMIDYYSANISQLGAPHYDVTDHPGRWDPLVGGLPAIRPSGPPPEGPFLYTGDLLFRKEENASVDINGTIYVDGDLTLLSPIGAYKSEIYLNGYTIFVTGDVDIQDDAYTLHGPGAIVALGNVKFYPSVTAGGFLFVMSVNGNVDFQPSGVYYGSVAGNNVSIQPNGFLFYPGPSYVDVPLTDRFVHILTWDIKLGN